MGSSRSQTVRRRLLRSAERVFAEKGFRAMTVREVTREARVNVAAVNYHFGSKRDLMRAVVEERFGPVNRLRIELLEEAAAASAPDPIPVKTIMKIMIEPLFELARKPADSGDVVIRMMGRCFAEPADFIREMNEEFFAEVRERFVAELLRSLPEQSSERVRAGFFFAVATIIGVISDGGEYRFDVPNAAYAPRSEAEVVNALVGFITGGLLR